MSSEELNSSLPPVRGRRSTNWLSRFPPFASALQSVSPRRRPALYYETLANLGSGGIVRLFPISLVVLETVLHADLWYQSVLAAVFFGGNLLSPIFTWLARHVRVRWLVIVPSLVMAMTLSLTAINPRSPGMFTTLVCIVLGLRVAMMIGEMNMFRLLYPATHLSIAVGWTRSVAAFSGLLLTLFGWWWLEVAPEYYWGLFILAALALCWGCWFYTKIPVHRSNQYSHDVPLRPVPAFVQGVKIFLSDKRFFRYELAFFIVGVANQMCIYLVPNVLNEYVRADDTKISLIAFVIPSLTMILTGPLWGSYLSRRTPMLARGIFSLMQVWTFTLYTYGGLTGTVWPFFVGSFIHACSIAGGSINWLTGSIYFARPEHVALYNGIHVFMTGIRGVLAPLVARVIYLEGATGFGFAGLGWGPWIFTLSAALSAIGAGIFFYSQQLESRAIESKSTTV